MFASHVFTSNNSLCCVMHVTMWEPFGNSWHFCMAAVGCHLVVSFKREHKTRARSSKTSIIFNRYPIRLLKYHKMPRYDYVALVRELRKPKQAVCTLHSFSPSPIAINIYGNQCVSSILDANSEIQQKPSPPPPQVKALRLANIEAVVARLKKQIPRRRRCKYPQKDEKILRKMRNFPNAPSTICTRRLYSASLTPGRNRKKRKTTMTIAAFYM